VVDARFQLVIEAACLIGIVLLAAVSSPILGGKKLDRAAWLRCAAVVVVGLAYLFFNPRGGPDPFPVVVWGTVFVAALIGLLLAASLGWRWTHGKRPIAINRQIALNFSYVVLFGFFALVCLAGVVISSIGTVQGMAARFGYDHAPSCATAPANACRSQNDARVIQTWAESARGRHWIQVSMLGRDQTIEITTATDVWGKLAPGTRVAVTSWKGRVTEVTLSGVGTMQAIDSPTSDLIPAIGLLVVSGLCLLVSSGYGLVYLLKWRLALRGIDPSQIAA
jgi:hypothetical protein